MNTRVKNYLLLLISLVFHLVAIGLVICFAWPIAEWYLKKIPARGIDLYNSATYVAYLMRHFAPFFSGWKYIWYEGSPLGADYPFLHFYLMVPFAKAFGLIRGIQVFALASNLILLIFSYFLFFELSRNRVLAVILSLAIAYTINLYRALVWAGGISYFASQMFLPVCLFLTVKYLRTHQKSWLYSLALVAGLGMLGHPQPFITTVFPVVLLLILFWVEEGRFFPWRKIKETAILALLTCLISLPTTHGLISVGIETVAAYILGILGRVPLGAGTGGPGSLAKSKGAYGAGSVLEEASPEIIKWAQGQFFLSFKDSHQLLWIFLGISVLFFIISLIFAKKRLRKIFSLFPFASGLFYVIFYAYLLSIGINIYHGGWYKVFWPIPVMTGALASFLWGKASAGFLELNVFKKALGKFWKGSGLLLINLLLILGAWYLFSTSSSFKEVIAGINKVSVVSSAFPGSLNVKIAKEEEKFKQELAPSFLNPFSKEFRLYAIDATLNIWWNAFFDLPLARGYIDPPHFGEAGAIFWLNSALSPSAKGVRSSLVDDWKVPEAIAKNNTQFLLDWFAIKYFEGNHFSQNNSALAPYATSDELIQRKEVVEVPGAIKYYDESWGGEAWMPEVKTQLNFYEIKDELVSPILSASNASAVAVIGDEGFYDTISRLFALLNLNSQKLIFVRGPKFIDDWKLEDLSNFDALILYGYDYHHHDKAWRLIEMYLKKGGKVFIETGGEVKESDSINLPQKFPRELPSIFPIRKTVRESLGRDWEIESNLDESWPINFNEFSPLELNGEVWNVSRPYALTDLDEESEVVIKNKGYPLIVAKKEGEGEIIWSGLNLPYHAVRNQNIEEANLFKMILAKLVNLEPSKTVFPKIEWLASEKRKVVGEGATGVIFKEQHFPGWSAQIKSKINPPAGGQKLKIYKAGPTAPGFMYVRIPESEAFEVTFQYRGDPKIWFYTGVSAITIIFILDYILLKQRLFGASIRYVTTRLGRRLGKWWEKEDEY